MSYVEWCNGVQFNKKQLAADERTRIAALSDAWIAQFFDNDLPIRDIESQLYRAMTNTVMSHNQIEANSTDSDAISRFDNSSDERSVEFFKGVVECSRPGTFTPPEK